MRTVAYILAARRSGQVEGSAPGRIRIRAAALQTLNAITLLFSLGGTYWTPFGVTPAEM
jgi:hypothetical protein